MINLLKLDRFINNLLTQAGLFLLQEQKKAQIKVYKDDVDIATSADLGAEKIIINGIQKKYPDHCIISEEKGAIKQKSYFCWYIDPLDGTKEYVRLMSAYNTALCLYYQNKPVFSAIYQPYSDLYFSAVKDQGAWLNQKPIKVNRKSSLKKSILYSHPPCFGQISQRAYHQAFETLKRISMQVYRLRFSSDENSHLSFLARGSIEAYMNFVYPIKSIQDAMPGLFIAREAGALITSLKGHAFNYNQDKQLYIASNGKIHAQLLKLIHNS